MCGSGAGCDKPRGELQILQQCSFFCENQRLVLSVLHVLHGTGMSSRHREELGSSSWAGKGSSMHRPAAALCCAACHPLLCLSSCCVVSQVLQNLSVSVMSNCNAFLDLLKKK